MRERKLYLKTFGCQMNDADSSKIKSLLGELNIGSTEEPKEADIILLNTCTIRWKAEHKVYSELGRFREMKEKRPHLIIGVGGCVAQQEQDEMFKKAPHLDIVFGTHNIHRLPEMIREVESTRNRVSETDFFDSPEPLVYPAPEEGGIKAYVNVMRGCNNFCAYCIVPYVRGRETSRPAGEVLEEVRRLAEGGVKEVTLLGQNVNSYGNGVEGEVSFARLIKKIAGVEGIERIRFATSHPKDLSLELIDAFGEVEKLCSHLHLPVQSGSDAVLEKMNRGYTVASYVDKVERLRRVKGEMAITTDIIVGFPGESPEDFAATLRLMEQIGYDGSFSFKYSRRPGTKAADFDDHTTEDEKDERLAALQALQREMSLEKNLAQVGQVREVLVEGASRKGEGMMTGRTSGNKVVNFPGNEALTGRVIPLDIVGGSVNSLLGEPCRIH